MSKKTDKKSFVLIVLRSGAHRLGWPLKCEVRIFQKDLPHMPPFEGPFIAYKKVLTAERLHAVAKLEIPKDAVWSIGLHFASRDETTLKRAYKCRASRAKVLEIRERDSGKKVDVAYARHDSTFVYRTGEEVKPIGAAFRNDWRECAPGIHFFMQRRRAVNYGKTW